MTTTVKSVMLNAAMYHVSIIKLCQATNNQRLITSLNYKTKQPQCNYVIPQRFEKRLIKKCASLKICKENIWNKQMERRTCER